MTITDLSITAIGANPPNDPQPESQDILKDIISTSPIHSSHPPLDDCLSLIDKQEVSIGSTDPLSLNWCSKRDLMNNKSILSETQCHLLKLLEEKERDFSKGFSDGNYFSNALPIIASESKHAQRFVCCGRQRGVNRVHCEKPMFCSKCASMSKNTAFRMYDPAFGRGTFQFLTISFNGHIPFDSINASTMLDYWDAVDGAISHLYSEDLIDGFYSVNELVIHQFLPLRIVPHGHAIIDTDAFTADHLAAINEYIAQHHPDLSLQPSIDVKRIRTRDDFFRTIGYCNKAIDLTGPYQTAIAFMGLSRKESMPALNREMREFLEGIPVITHGRKKILRRGTMSPQCTTRYIGATVKQRKKSLRNPLAQTC